MDYFSLNLLVRADPSHPLVQERLQDPNQRDHLGYTLLHAAAQSPDDNPGLVQLILESGADVNSASPSGYTPLHLAACTRKRYLIDLLIDAGASINSQDRMGRTALHYAISKKWSILDLNIDCDIWVVERLLLEPDIHPNLVDHRGQTPLMWAVKECHQDAANLLLKKGGNPNIPNDQNRTPFHEALLAGSSGTDIVLSLLVNGAGIYCADKWGKTPVGIIIRLFKDARQIPFVLQCFRLIALRYRVTESLMLQLESVPVLRFRVMRLIKEVQIMHSLVVYEAFTPHDVALDCYPSPKDPKVEIYQPVVELLVTEYIVEYFDLISIRVSRRELREMLNRISIFAVIYQDASSFDMLNIINIYYKKRENLNKRLRLVKETLDSFYDQKLAFDALRNHGKLLG